MALTSKWDGSGRGIKTSPWKRKSYLDTAPSSHGLRRVGLSGTIQVVESAKPRPDYPRALCSVCGDTRIHWCPLHGLRANSGPQGDQVEKPSPGSAPETSSKAAGYTQRHEAHPTKVMGMGSVLVRVEKQVPQSQRLKGTKTYL
jgi:hypothetical protein